MKRTIWFLSSFVMLLFVSFGCSSSDDNDVSTDAGAQTTETSFNFTLASFKSQETASAASGMQFSFTADQVMTGQLTATNTSDSSVQTFDWSIYFDEDTFAVQSNKTIILAPGTYEFALLLTKGDQQYAGSAVQAISDGTFDVPMTIRPIIGNTVTDVTLLASLAEFKFSYDPAELAAASLANPQMGIIVDGGAEEVFTINPGNGISDNYINLDEGQHSIQLALYDGSLQRGRSISAQETVIVSAGLNITMDLVALHGETTFALTEAGGDANFTFNIPAEAVDEAGGVTNLEVLFSIVGSNNLLEENTLDLSQAVSGDYEAQITLSNKQFDEVTLSLAFTDKLAGELLGACTMAATLNTTERTVNCELTLRRRAIIGGSLLATLGINVFNEAGEPVVGAVVSENGNILGITGSGAFGTTGYLRTYLNAASYTIRGESAQSYGESNVTLTALAISNIDVVLNTALIQSTMPDTGQTSSFTTTFGEDHDYLINPPSFLDNGNGTITDNHTLLVWQQAGDNAIRNWSNAVTYCEDLILGGQSDWRLPYPKEMQSIANYNVWFPAINASVFPGTNPSFHWTYGTCAHGSDFAWAMGFDDGNMAEPNKAELYFTRCVRSGSSLDIWQSNYTDHGDGTVMHIPTGLNWQQADDDSSKTWENALLYCENLDLGGSTDWRLPNIRELQSIANYYEYNPSISTAIFPGTESDGYWSSTTNAPDPMYAWIINFNLGSVIYGNTDDTFRVRCVQGGQ